MILHDDTRRAIYLLDALMTSYFGGIVRCPICVERGLYEHCTLCRGDGLIAEGETMTLKRRPSPRIKSWMRDVHKSEMAFKSYE